MHCTMYDALVLESGLVGMDVLTPRRPPSCPRPIRSDHRPQKPHHLPSPGLTSSSSSQSTPLTIRTNLFFSSAAKSHPLDHTLKLFRLLPARDTVTKPRGCLPYGMLLTHIFKHFGINLRNEDGYKLSHTDKYSLYTLHRMGFIKVNGEWRRENKAKEKVEKNKDNSDDDSWDTPPGTSAPPPAAAPAPAPASRMHQEDLDYIIQGLASTYPYHSQSSPSHQDPSISHHLSQINARIDHLEKQYESLVELHKNYSSQDNASLASEMIKVVSEIAELKENATFISGSNVALRHEIKGLRKLIQDIRNAILPPNAFPPQPTQYQAPPTQSEIPQSSHAQSSETQPPHPDISQTQSHFQTPPIHDYSQQTPYQPYGQQFPHSYPYQPYGSQYQMPTSFSQAPSMYGMPPIYAQPLQQHVPSDYPSTVFEPVFPQSTQANPFRSPAPHLRRTRRRGEGSSSEPTYIIPDDEESNE